MNEHFQCHKGILLHRPIARKTDLCLFLASSSCPKSMIRAQANALGTTRSICLAIVFISTSNPPMDGLAVADNG